MNLYTSNYKHTCGNNKIKNVLLQGYWLG